MEEVDVLVIGGGSAGLCAGVWLARTGISYRILERRPGRLEMGQADGVQVRTVELFESFGLEDRLWREAYHVLEAVFWSDEGNTDEGIRRTSSAPDTEAGLSHLPHVILNRWSLINKMLSDDMERAAGSTNIVYGCEFESLAIDEILVDDPDAHCITATAVKNGEEQLYKAKYLLGSDGAHSRVRKALGIGMVGGSDPYEIDFAETAWWSAYVIGQRLAGTFHVHHRVFLGGDACHTHSPKAGQGMNVSLQDGYNIGWKLAAVLRKQVDPKLLETYILERQATAGDLINFDRYWTKLFSTADKESGGGITPELFAKAGRYTNLTVGMRFPSAQVVRVCDARHRPLTTALPADSRWHIVIFGGDVGEEAKRLRLHKLASDLEIMISRFTPPETDPDSVLNTVLVLSSKRSDVALDDIPQCFTPVTGKWKMQNVLNIFVDDEGYNNSGHGHAYDAYGVDPKQGAIIVVRPDLYISKIGSLDDISSVETFFRVFLKTWTGHTFNGIAEQDSDLEQRIAKHMSPFDNNPHT
ncbi:thioredoxin-like protein [Xylariaceae sp. FL1019]|nr:thioredoxin-like protein [Xylariaceae sp. FL1019]